MHDETKQPAPEVEDAGEGRAPQEQVGEASAQGASSGDAGADVSSSLKALKALLRRTERDLRRPVLVEGALWAASAALAVALSALAVAAIFEAQGALIARWILLVGLGAVGVSAAVAYGLFRVRRRGELASARIVQAHAREYRNDLVAALEFGERLGAPGAEEELKRQGVSAALASAHVRRTAKRVLGGAKEQSLAHVVPPRDLRAPGAAAGLLGVVLLGVMAWQPGWTLGVLSGDRVGASVVGDRVRVRPIVGQIDAIFVYPEYTGMPRQMARLGSGFVETLEGTRVHLQLGLWPEGFEKVELVRSWHGEGGQQQEVLPVQLGPGHQGSVSLTMKESGSYMFRAVTAEGVPVEDGVERTIRVVADASPEVRLTSHQPGPEPMIVQPDDVLELSVEALDDFGLSGLSLVHQFGNDEEGAVRRSLDVSELASKPQAVEHRLSFDLAELGLQPKDRVSIYFSATDTNTVTGPGEGRSESLVIYVESPEDQHLRNIAEQQALLEALLLHLADVLEAPPGERVAADRGGYRMEVSAGLDAAARSAIYEQGVAHHQARELILSELEGLRVRVAEDPMMSGRNAALFDGLAAQLKGLQAEGRRTWERLQARSERGDLTMGHVQSLADFSLRVEDELEKALLRFDELLARQKMELVEATAEDLKAMRERLRELLEQYRDTEDEALKEAIKREVQRLRQRMAELMARMQMQMEQLPRDHVNMEALEQMQMESESKQLGDQLQSIEDLLEQGDIDGALAELDKMDELLNGLNSQVEQGMEQAAPQGISELDRQMGELMKDVSELQEMERAIEEQTRELEDAMAEEQRESIQKMVAPAVDELLKKVAEQEADLERMAQLAMPVRDQGQVAQNADQVARLRAMLEQQDLQLALEEAELSERRLRGMRSTLSLSERYVREEAALNALRRGRQMSDRLAERADDIVKMLREFMQQASQARQNQQGDQQQRYEELAERQQQARERAEGLRQKVEQTGERFPMVRDQVMPSLEQATESMQEAEEQLRQGEGQQALDRERSALEQLGQLGEQMRQAMQKERRQQQRSGGQQKTEKVEIPGASSREAQERLRREMMEGMREGRLEDYDSEIERYYRSLVE